MAQITECYVKYDYSAIMSKTKRKEKKTALLLKIHIVFIEIYC